MLYLLRQEIVLNPEIELPEGSQVASIKHRDAYHQQGIGIDVPETWQVVWLEPKVE